MSTSHEFAQYDSSRPSKNFASIFKLFFEQRALIFLLVENQLKARYRRSFLGLFWTLINPMLSGFILWIVFVSIFKDNLKGGTQFAPYLLAGVLIVTFFNQSLLQSAEAISNGSGIFLKIKVAPQIFSLASSIANAMNLLIGVIPLLVVSIISESPVRLLSPLILIVIVSLILFTTGLGLILGILFVQFNDTKFIVTVLLQLITYLTPVFYPKDVLGDYVRVLVSLNPLTSYLEIFRHLFNGTEIATLSDWVYMLGSSSLVFIFGLYVFDKYWKKTVVML